MSGPRSDMSADEDAQPPSVMGATASLACRPQSLRFWGGLAALDYGVKGGRSFAARTVINCYGLRVFFG